MKVLMITLTMLIIINVASLEETTEVMPVSDYLSSEIVTDNFVFEAAPGDTVGEISIPSLGIKASPLYYLPTLENLKKGVCIDGPPGGWQVIGENGKSMISAHNDKAFKRLDKVSAGDDIFVSMIYGDYAFQVEETYIYKHDSDDWKAAAYESTTENGLVLVTCYPLNKRNVTGDKLIVRCKPV